MELRVLRYFLAAAREENITKAAALLHLTQPTLPRQLMQLEEELGVQLFQRSRYRIMLTEEGMLLRRRAQELVDLADKTAREFTGREKELMGEIAIGAGESRSMTFLSPAMETGTVLVWKKDQALTPATEAFHRHIDHALQAFLARENKH